MFGVGLVYTEQVLRAQGGSVSIPGNPASLSTLLRISYIGSSVAILFGNFSFSAMLLLPEFQLVFACGQSFPFVYSEFLLRLQTYPSICLIKELGQDLSLPVAHSSIPYIERVLFMACNVMHV